MNIEHPCTTLGCRSVKYFPGRCNPCQTKWEAIHLKPLDHSHDTETWVEEQMRKQREGIR